MGEVVMPEERIEGIDRRLSQTSQELARLAERLTREVAALRQEIEWARRDTTSRDRRPTPCIEREHALREEMNRRLWPLEAAENERRKERDYRWLTGLDGRETERPASATPASSSRARRRGRSS